MTPEEARHLLRQYRDGIVDENAALSALTAPAVSDLGFAQVDLARGARTGFGEVIFGAGKTPEQVAAVRAAGCTLGQGYHFSRAVPDYLAAMLLAQERHGGELLRATG